MSERDEQAVAWLIPTILETEGRRCCVDMVDENATAAERAAAIEDINGTVAWGASIFCDSQDMPRVDKHGVKHFPKPLYPASVTEALRAEVAEKERECQKLGNHAVAIEESVNRLKAKGAAEHKDHLFCPHCNPCRRAEKINEANARATAAEAALAARPAEVPEYMRQVIHDFMFKAQDRSKANELANGLIEAINNWLAAALGRQA